MTKMTRNGHRGRRASHAGTLILAGAAGVHCPSASMIFFVRPPSGRRTPCPRWPSPRRGSAEVDPVVADPGIRSRPPCRSPPRAPSSDAGCRTRIPAARCRPAKTLHARGSLACIVLGRELVVRAAATPVAAVRDMEDRKKLVPGSSRNTRRLQVRLWAEVPAGDQMLFVRPGAGRLSPTESTAAVHVDAYRSLLDDVPRSISTLMVSSSTARRSGRGARVDARDRARYVCRVTRDDGMSFANGPRSSTRSCVCAPDAINADVVDDGGAILAFAAVIVRLLLFVEAIGERFVADRRRTAVRRSSRWS